jgi:hypothetical protein
MADELVTIRESEYDALLAIVAAAERAHYLQTGHGWVEALDGIWDALGAYYQLIPARRPSGTEPHFKP